MGKFDSSKAAGFQPARCALSGRAIRALSAILN
jgi:hypothetical protein